MSKILLVDDEIQIAKALGRLLRREGYEVEQAASGAEALEKLSAFVPDLVISDFRMAGMNGAELLAEVRKRCPLALRLILSGYADLRSFLSSINEGEICRFVTKPWDDATLLALLRQLLASRELLATFYHPFLASRPGLESEALQEESRLVIRLQRSGVPFSSAQAMVLLEKFAGALDESDLKLVGGLLARHSGKISFVAEVGAEQRLTLELPLGTAERAEVGS